MKNLNCFEKNFTLNDPRFIYQNGGEKPTAAPEQASKGSTDDAKRDGKKADVKDKYGDDKLETPDAQKKMYAERLTTFVDKLRKGEAHDYGFRGIVDGFFGDKSPKGVTMVDHDEKLLTQEDKNKVAQEVLQKTGLTKQEAAPLVEKAAKRAREEAAKAKDEMKKKFEGK
jgi:hypothetical protein